MASDTEKANCKRKKKYSSDFEAQTALKKSRRYSGHVPSRVYKCPVCFNWHLTSSKKR
jgi:hypothetical protein